MDKPWFKFTANNWLSGSVQLLSDGEKGTYIDLMAKIWKEGGSLKVDKILSRKLRLDHATVCDRIDSYCELNILVCEDDVLSIKFLSDQLEAINEVSKKNSDNAKKRWSKDKLAMRPNANKKREEEKRIEKKENKKETNPCVEIIMEYFRSVTGSKHREAGDLGARLKDGYTVDDAKLVIDKKFKEWNGTDMAKYIRPTTLFSKSKFDGYLNEIPKTNQQQTQSIADRYDFN